MTSPDDHDSDPSRGAAMRRALLHKLIPLEYQGEAALGTLELDRDAELRGAIELDADAFLRPLAAVTPRGSR